MTITIVSTTAQLIAVLHGAMAGDTIKLAPGTYSNVRISGRTFGATKLVGASQVLIESEFSNRPAVLTDLNVQNSSGLAFVGLKLSTIGDAIGPFGAAGTTPFEIAGSSNIALRSLTVSGNQNGTLANTLSAVFIRSSSYITVSQSSFSYLHAAINQLDNNYVIITGNTFSHIYDDGVRGGGTSNINISGNTFTDFHPDPLDTDHPDLVQFWTTNTTSSASNITVSHNTFTRGSGGAPQGIFINDEVGDLPYSNVTVDYNSLLGTQYHGIAIDDVNGASVIGNTVTSYTDYNSSIDLYNSENVLSENNRAESYEYTGSTRLSLSNNQIIAPLPLPAAVFVRRLLIEEVSPAPEPRSWALMVAGLAVLGLFRRRLRRSASVTAGGGAR